MNRILRVALFFALFSYNLEGFSSQQSSLDNQWNHFSHDPILEIAVIGERNSGTNYLRKLLAYNFPKIKMCSNRNYESNEYAHKHFFPWFDLTEFGFPHLKNPAKFPLIHRSKRCLFVCIIRNPHDWVRSFYLKPYHVEKRLFSNGRLRFMSGTWEVESHPLVNPDKWNPYTEKPFKNVFELRKFKTLNYLKIGKIVNNFVLVRYEDLTKSPLEFIEYLANLFNLQRPLMINPEADYERKAYPAFNPKEEKFFLNEVDWETEKLVGYAPFKNSTEPD